MLAGTEDGNITPIWAKMTAEIVTIGDEILTGHTVNTNAAFIGERLTEIDCRVLRETAVGDDVAAITAVFREALARAEVVIATGGLGPTHDDVTRTAVVEAFDRPLAINHKVRESLEAFFAARGRALDKINEAQALLPAGADFVPNNVGTAVGIHLIEKKRHFYALPGVPAEMRPMITDHIIPFLKTLSVLKTAHGVLYTTGKPESKLYEMLRPVLDKYPQVKVAFLPGFDGVKIQYSAALGTLEESERALNQWRADTQEILGNVIYSETEGGVELVIGSMLQEKGATMAIAESCTGGLIAWRITEIPGSSEYFVRGYVTYSNESKSDLLGVDPGVIEAEGAVSEVVARQMAEGARAGSGAEYAIAVTGIAGPTGGTADKPVGLTYVALAGGGATVCRKYQLGTDRSTNRQRASQAALNLLRERLLGVV